MVEVFRLNLLAHEQLSDEYRVRLAEEADKLEGALRVALRSDVGAARTIPWTLASVRLDQPEHAGLLDGEADAAEALATSLRSTAAAIRLVHELRRRSRLA
jgi:hypothetical protein